MKKITEKLIGLLSEMDKEYVQIIREHAYVRDGINNMADTMSFRKSEALLKSDQLAKGYISSLKQNMYNKVADCINDEILCLSNVKNPEGKTDDTLSEIKKSNLIAVITAEINGTDDQELFNLITSYKETDEYGLFQKLIKPRILDIQKRDPLGSQLANKLKEHMITKNPEAEVLKSTLSDINSLLFFQNASIEIGVMPTNSERFVKGNGNFRIIDYDLNNANPNFNPLNVDSNPIVINEQIGSRKVRTTNLKYAWNIE